MTSAEEIYVVLGNQKRFSRYFRAEWLIRQYVQSRQSQQKVQDDLDQIGDSLKLVSSVPPAADDADPVFSASTAVYFLADSHAFVFLLDLSYSQRTVDTVSEAVLFDDVLVAFGSCLRGLVQSLLIPGRDVKYMPMVFVTVLAHVPLHQLGTRKPLQVLVQGRRLTSEAVDLFLADIRSQVARMETVMCKDTKSERNPQALSTEFGLADMIRSCTLALQLLPDAVGGLVVVSDGVCELPDANNTETLLHELRSYDIACSFLKVGGTSHPEASFGFVPNTDLLRFIAEASGGAYLAHNTLEFEDISGYSDECSEMNVYQKLMLCRTIQAVSSEWRPSQLCYESYFEKQQCPPPMRKRYSEETIQIDLIRFVGSRVREGFQLRDIFFSRRDTQLEVKIVLPWKEEVKLEYHVVTPWPTNQAGEGIHVSLVVEASYDFLVDITAKKALGNSPFRAAVVRRFLQTVRTFQRSDQLMIHLRSFSTVPVHHSVPQSARDGMPLFYLQPGSANPVLSQGVASPSRDKGKKSKGKDPIFQFAAFWRPVISLDTAIWHRWFHVYRIAVQLDYDAPLPKHLHVPNANSRYSTVQCRQAAGILYSVLSQDWSTFVLLENHSYIRFITRFASSNSPFLFRFWEVWCVDHSGPESDSSSPSHFCLARLTQKAPHMVVRLAFVAGTPPGIQLEIVEDMRAMLNKLVVERHTPRKPMMSVTLKGRQKKLVSQETISRTCAVVLNRVPERILVRYDKIPPELNSEQQRKSESLNVEIGVHGAQPGDKTLAGSATTAVMRSIESYLHHKRWIWRLHPERSDHESSSLGVAAVGNMLSALLQLRLRERFHIASSTAGIVFLIKELDMKGLGESTKPCLLQYVLFPPLTCRSSSFVEHSHVQSHSAVNVLKARELQVVTESWIEPQCGVCTNCSPSMRHLEGLTYQEILNEIHRSTVSVLSTLCTYEQLFLMCCHPGLCPPKSILRVAEKADESRGFVHVPFLFDVCSLLRQAQQVELFFSGFSCCVSQSDQSNSEANSRLLALLVQKLGALCQSNFMIQDDDAAQLTEQIQLRCPDDERRHQQLRWLSKDRGWTCFLKPVGDSRLFVVLVPDGAAEYNLTSSQKKNETDTVIPVYLYECHQLVVSGERENKEEHGRDVNRMPILGADVFDDLTFVKQTLAQYSSSSEAGEEALSCFREHGRRIGRNSRNASTTEFVGGVSTELTIFRERVKEAYYQSFVEATFSSLQNGNYVAGAQITGAVELCEESRIEIDLNDFLLAICCRFNRKKRQAKEAGRGPVLEKTVSFEEDGDTTFLRGTGSRYSHSTSICQLFGNMIESQFGSILESNFLAVSTNQEFFYFSPSDSRSLSSSQSSVSLRDRPAPVISGCTESSDSDFISRQNGPESHEDSDGFEEVFSQDAADDEVEVAFLGSVPVSGVDRDEEEEDDVAEDGHLPLFISFICSVKDKQTGNIYVTTPLQTIPTCLEKIVEHLDLTSTGVPYPPDLGSLDVSVTLDITMFTLPQQETLMIMGRSRLTSENIQGNSPSPDQGKFERRLAFRSFSPSLSDNSDEDEQVLDPLGHLSDGHRKAVEDLRDEIAWLMKDEIVAAARTVVPVTQTTLEMVVHHIQSRKLPSCQFVRVPILFVNGAEHSMHRFIQEFESMSITGYNLNKVESYYYLSEDRSLSRRWHLKSASVYSSLETLDSQMRDDRRTSGDVTPSSHHDSLQVPPTYVSQCSMGYLSLDSTTTYDAAAGEGSEDECSTPYPVRLPQEDAEGHAIAACPDLWLILKISSHHVDIYFHSRYSEQSTEQLKNYDLLRETVETEVISKCREVNQAMLLINLFEKRTCHQLLLSESKEDTWAQGHVAFSSSPLSFSYASLSFDPERDAINALPPGHFECEEQFRAHIPLHWRLSAGPGGVAALGLQAAHTALAPFAVSNRKNMYVYQEGGGSENIYYIRLSESMCLTGSTELSKKPVVSQTFFDPTSSRASSVSLRGASEYGDDWSIGGNGNRRSSIEPNDSQVDQSVVVEVYGVSKPGPDVTVELVGILQKRIESALLRIMTSMLTRNPSSKLDVADVQFIQPIGMTPTAKFFYCLPTIIPVDQRSFMYYLRQHLLQFLVAPNYQTLSPECQFRHAPSGEREATTILPYDCVFVYWRPRTAATEGLACVYVELSGFECGNDEEDCTFDITQHKISDLTAITESKSATVTGGIPFVQFQLWERGDIGRVRLKKELIKRLEHALYDYILEYFVLLMPLTPLPPMERTETETADDEDEAETEKFQEWAIVTISHPKPGQSHGLALRRDTTVHSGAEVIVVQPRETGGLTLQGTEKNDMECDKLVQSITYSSGSYKEDSEETMADSPETSKRPQSQAIETPPKKRDQHVPETRRFRRLFSDQPAAQLPAVSPGSNSLPKEVKLILRTAHCDSSSDSPVAESKSFKTVPVWLAKEMHRRERERLYDLLEKAALGETGSLTKVFWQKSVEVLDLACKKECSSVHFCQVTLLSRYAIDYVMKEIEQAVPTFFHGALAKIFRLSKVDESYHSYSTGKASLESTSNAGSSINVVRTKLPLGSQSFIITGRNLEDWKYTIEALGGVSQSNKASLDKPAQQKFMPFDASLKSDKLPGELTFFEQDHFIPRQKFFLFRIEDKKIAFYTYNCPADLNGRIDRFLNRLSDWQNTRSRFLDFLLGQKMGLFHHFRVGYSKDLREPAAVLKRNSSDLDQLVKQAVPPVKEVSQRERGSIYGTSTKSLTTVISQPTARSRFARSTSPSTGPQSPTSTSPYRPGRATGRSSASNLDDFEGLFRETFPRVPLHRTQYSSHTDPVKRHGQQALELKAYQKKIDNRTVQLLDILDTWQSRTKQKTAISADLVVVLKNTARLIHYCNSPLLLSRKWRKTLMQSSCEGEAMGVNVSLDIPDDGAVPSGETASCAKQLTSNSNVGFDGNEEDYWHQCVRYAFMNEYVAYLEQQLGFSVIDVKPGSSTLRASSVDSDKESSPSPFCVFKSTRKERSQLLTSKCLQKTLVAGIILIELSFQDFYFSVRLYALEASRVRRDIVLNAQMSKLFTDECSHLKDLMHVHSFAYDFHLRQVHNFLCSQPGVQSLLPNGYPLMDFLEDFSTLCASPPSYIRNRLQADDIRVSIPVTATAEDLFRYLLANSSVYGLTTLETNVNPFSAAVSPCEPVWNMAAGDKLVLLKAKDCLLFSRKKGMLPGICQSDIEFYSYLLVSEMPQNIQMVSLDSTELQGSSYELHLRFYLVLISRHDVFPRLTLASPRGWKQSVVKMIGSTSSSRKEATESTPSSQSDPFPTGTEDHLDVDDLSIDDNLSVASAPILDPTAVGEQLEQVRLMLDDAIRRATKHYRRDILWKRLLFGYNDPGSGRGESSSSRRGSSGSQMDQGGLAQLTFEEFDELLCLVSTVSLDSMDQRLVPFLRMNREWYHGLVSGLTARFGDRTRAFKRADGTIFRLTVMSPECHDAFVLLTLHATGTRNKAELTIVYKRSHDQWSFHTSNETVSEQEQACRVLTDSVVNFICFRVWSLLTK